MKQDFRRPAHRVVALFTLASLVANPAYALPTTERNALTDNAMNVAGEIIRRDYPGIAGLIKLMPEQPKGGDYARAVHVFPKNAGMRLLSGLHGAL